MAAVLMASSSPSTADGAPPGDEAALVADLQRGAPEAYERLVRTYGGRLLSVARRFLRNEEDAREALQDAFLSAFRGIQRFSGQSRLATWLHRITVNAALMKLRKRTANSERLIDDLLPKFASDGHHAEPADSWARGPDQIVAARETRELVRTAIDELPEIYRTVLMLRDIDELDTAETAQLLGVSDSVVKTRLHRARQALRTALDRRLAEHAR
jgi:RNA polymerase sigma-70 factor (ECF subfamily)